MFSITLFLIETMRPGSENITEDGSHSGFCATVGILRFGSDGILSSRLSLEAPFENAERLIVINISNFFSG